MSHSFSKNVERRTGQLTIVNNLTMATGCVITLISRFIEAGEPTTPKTLTVTGGCSTNLLSCTFSKEVEGSLRTGQPTIPCALATAGECSTKSAN